MNECIFTIGHSNHSVETFFELLQVHSINAIVDIRSHPYSNFVPHFSKKPIRDYLERVGIAYVFLGKELGARSNNSSCYRNGKIQFDLLAQEPKFVEGIERIIHGMSKYRIAIMCSEKDPIDCHRALLVSRKLYEANIFINHIHSNKTLETQDEIESRLLKICKLADGDLFKSRKDYVEEAYEIQSQRIAYESKLEKEIHSAL
ncbi:MAG: DUF488 domain-containing protein [Thermoleophilia bacterium]